MIEVIQGDCREVLAGTEAESFDAVYTDPPWPGSRIDTGWRGPVWWASVIREVERVLRPQGKVLLHLGSQTDPRDILAPITLPFIHVCWLRYTPPRYRGNILNCGDIAFCFGYGFLPTGRRVLTQEHNSSSRGHRSTEHPCERNLAHVYKLLESQVGPGRRILDPFFGSGTTGVAGKRLGCDVVGIDTSGEYCEMARKRCAQDVTQELFT